MNMYNRKIPIKTEIPIIELSDTSDSDTDFDSETESFADRFYNPFEALNNISINEIKHEKNYENLLRDETDSEDEGVPEYVRPWWDQVKPVKIFDRESIKRKRSIYLCQICGVLLNEANNFYKHYYSHKKPTVLANINFFCEICDKRFKSEESLKNHLMKHDWKQKYRFKCLCGEAYEYMESLQGHIINAIEKEPEVHRYQCSGCEVSFVDINDYWKHQKVHYPNFCDLCNKFMSCESSFKTHIQIVHSVIGKKFQCDLCDLSLKTKHSLLKHRKKHFEPRAQCPHCKKYFMSDVTLKQHDRIVHQGLRPFVCELCNKTFNQMGSLKYHLKLHTGDRPFTCEHCGRGFKIAKDLKKHISVHLSDQQLKCNLCEASFGSSIALRRHSKIHSNSQSEIFKVEFEEIEVEEVFLE